MPDERSVKTNLILRNGAKMLGRKHDDFHPSGSELWPPKGNGKN